MVVGDYNREDVGVFLTGTSFQVHPGRWYSNGPRHRAVYTSWSGTYVDHVCTNEVFREAFDIEVTVLPVDLSDHFPVQVDVTAKLGKGGDH